MGLLLIRNTPPQITPCSPTAFPLLAGFCHSLFLPCPLQGSPDLSTPGGASPLQQQSTTLAMLMVPAMLAVPAVLVVPAVLAVLLGQLGASQKQLPFWEKDGDHRQNLPWA